LAKNRNYTNYVLGRLLVKLPVYNSWHKAAGSEASVGLEYAGMKKTSRTASQLTKFMRNRQFVRFTRRFEQGSVRGYVLDVGPRFFLLASQGDEIRFDGFSCFRLGDVNGLRPDPYAAFAEAALKRLRVPMPKKPKVSVVSIGELLLSASKAFPLLTIHRETVDPDVCWIGKIKEVQRGQVSLLEIGPDAKWDREPTAYRMNEITSVEFGGEYERALHLVGGNPPVQ
jgi:hypothetical protein